MMETMIIIEDEEHVKMMCPLCSIEFYFRILFGMYFVG